MTPEELLKEVGEPVACVDARDWEWHANNSPETTLGVWTTSDWKRKLNLPNQVPMFFYTSDQVASAILKATKPLEDQLAAAQEENERLRIALGCTKRDLVRMRCPDFFEGVKDGYETLFDGHLVSMIGLINDYAKQK